MSGSQRKVADSAIRTRATPEDVNQPHTEQEMAPRIFRNTRTPQKKGAFLLILLLILQRVFLAKRSKAERHQDRESTYENRSRRNIAKTSKSPQFKL
ncbi:MAG TPA: hypothetical protein VGI85_11870 [Chthoniobacterales bacterium]